MARYFVRDNGSVPDRGEEEEPCIELARKRGAKSLELPAATSLARLWQSQGKLAEACDLLAPIYNWFTEGLDTADLKDAKALLDDLTGTSSEPSNKG